jgi:hypothetical protein
MITDLILDVFYTVAEWVVSWFPDIGTPSLNSHAQFASVLHPLLLVIEVFAPVEAIVTALGFVMSAYIGVFTKKGLTFIKWWR